PLRGLLDQVLQERHRLFQWMPRRRIEVQHISLTPPVEVAAPLVREEDLLFNGSLALPPCPIGLDPEEGIAQVKISLDKREDLIVCLPRGENVDVAVGLELGAGTAENVIEDTQGL